MHLVVFFLQYRQQKKLQLLKNVNILKIIVNFLSEDILQKGQQMREVWRPLNTQNG